MPLAIALVVLFVLLCTGGIVLWARLAGASARAIEVPAGEPDRLFRGDVMCRHLITSGSLARLELYDWGVRLHGTVISRWIVPTWEARYDELAIAELAALPASRVAVWLRLRGEAGAIGFLSDRSQEILPLLAGHGVPVNRSVTRVRRVEELYQQSR